MARMKFQLFGYVCDLQMRTCALNCEGGRGRGSGSLDVVGGVLSVTFFLFFKYKIKNEGNKETKKERTNGEYSVGVTIPSSPTDRNGSNQALLVVSIVSCTLLYGRWAHLVRIHIAQNSNQVTRAPHTIMSSVGYNDAFANVSLCCVLTKTLI